MGLRPGDTGIDGRTDTQLRHSKRLHHGTRGLASGHHKTPDVLANQLRGNLAQTLFYQMPRSLHPNGQLGLAHLVGRGGGVNEHLVLVCGPFKSPLRDRFALRQL